MHCLRRARLEFGGPRGGLDARAPLASMSGAARLGSMAAELTPMMKQYHAIRQSLPSDVLLLFRLGDFYELFFEDAKTAADILSQAAFEERANSGRCAGG